MEEKANRRRRKRTFIYLWVLLALLTLLVAATYTWFAISQTPHVNDMAMYVNSDSGLELALAYDAPDEEWGQKLDFIDIVSEDYPLKPATWSEVQKSLVSIRYGFDGRMAGELITLTDDVNANRKDSNGYYVVGVFYARSHAPCKVSLAEAVELNEGVNGAGTYVIGTPVWDAETLLHYDGGNGAETAIRIGFRLTPIDPNSGETIGESEFFIYEPNCDGHIGGDEGYVPTPSIDGTDTLIDADHLILQNVSTWTEADPVQRLATIKDLGEFMNNEVLFSLDPAQKVKIEMYIWLDGQDADCIPSVDDARILASIQFHADYTGQSGMEDIEDEK
ncbi:MAG: hypothetical protein IJS45_07785 [Clostridia bacterium]|nr:hypothetical protein [Clostridia bacterium]